MLAAAEGKENIDSLKGEEMAVWTGEGVLEMDFDELLRIRGKKN